MLAHNKKPGKKIIYCILIIAFTINLTIAGEWSLWEEKYTPKKDYAKWCFSFYLAGAFGGPANDLNSKVRNPGFQDSYNSSANVLLSTLSTISPTSWMLHVDYRIIQELGMGLMFSNSVVGETILRLRKPGSLGRDIGLGSSVKTMALLFTIHLNEHIILGIGPTYNMTDSPSNANRLGLLAHLNIRVPIHENFSVDGIMQYRYVGITNIGPYYLEDVDELPPPSVTTSTMVFPESQINYSHLFVGIGISTFFQRK
jgi:hypothetical protein